MDFEWNEDDRGRYDAIYSQTRLWSAPDSGYFTSEEWKLCAGLGLLGLSMPKEYGGKGCGFLATARAAEAFGHGAPDMGLVFAALAHLFACGMPIAEHGDEALRREMLPRLSSGEWIGANAITEEGAGSDATGLAARAVRTGEEYVLTGDKCFVSNGPVADVFVVYAVTQPDLGYLGVSAFVLDRETPGLTVGEPFGKLGLDRCPASTLRLDRCVVPARRRLGAEGQGAAIFQDAMRWERTCLFAAYIGRLERLTELSAGHARTRIQFGRPIGSNQAVSHRLARMRMRLETARLLLWRACWLLEQNEPARAEVAMAKLSISEAAAESAMDAIRIFGGDGIRSDRGIERELRDAIPSLIFSGTSEMQLELIARELGL
ncbi:MAG TPA: acyl-CoA dehydrogenase family protein [Trebonia sp.]|jgi:alkylation response protein AidB-like acyl-CoA dehydrogenase